MSVIVCEYMYITNHSSLCKALLFALLAFRQGLQPSSPVDVAKANESANAAECSHDVPAQPGVFRAQHLDQLSNDWAGGSARGVSRAASDRKSTRLNSSHLA